VRRWPGGDYLDGKIDACSCGSSSTGSVGSLEMLDQGMESTELGRREDNGGRAFGLELRIQIVYFLFDGL